MQAPVRADALTKTYRVGFWGRRVRAVEDLSFEVRAGEIFGLLGPNGAGKTTTLKMLLGFVKPTSGHAWISGNRVGTVSSRNRIKDTVHLGYDEVLTSDQFVDALADQPVDVVVDPVGGDIRTATLDVLAPLGRILLLGHAAHSPDTPVTGDQLWLKNAGLLGFSVGPYLLANPASARPAAEQVMPLLGSGHLTLQIDELSLTQAADAHQRLEAHQVPGRLVLTV